MANIIFPKRWTQKPPNSVLNFGHPLARGMRLCVPFSEFGSAIAAGSILPPWRNLVRNTPANVITGSGQFQQVETQGGLGVNCGNTDLKMVWGTDTNIPIPTARATVLLIRRKVDATARVSSVFGADSINSGTGIFNCHLPYSDGTGYWDFGGSTGSNRITFPSMPTQGVQKWVFVAGSRGSAMYLNGILESSQSTAISRTTSGANFGIAVGAAGAADLQDYYFFAVLEAEWTQSMVQWWNAEPYAMLSPAPPLRRMFAAPGVATPLTAYGDDSFSIVPTSGFDQNVTVF